MFDRETLVELHRSLARERVLSVYIDGTATDPAVQRTWRLQLEHGLKEIRTQTAGSPRDERITLERIIGLLDGELAAFDATIGSPGWVAFITADGTRAAHHLPVPVATTAVWNTGACIAPYLRALKETHPVIIALADARRVTLFQYALGKVHRLEALRAHHPVDHPSHMGVPARSGFHSGTRGTTGHDAAQRALLSGQSRLIAETVDRIRCFGADDAWIVLGGTPRVVARLADQLSAFAPHRTLVRHGLDVHASEAAIAGAARAAASTLRNAANRRAIADVADLADAGGLGALGSVATIRALEQACVRELYVSHRYLQDHPADIEKIVRAALDQNALVDDISGDAADELDAHGGMCARLRFRPGGAAAS
jgi:hypothetical protein